MATFATELDVRTKFLLSDPAAVPAELVLASLNGAHEELLRYLDPAYAEGTPDGRLVLGEILLAGAHLYRSFAGKDAFDQKQVTLGGQRVDAGKRFEALTSFSTLLETSAWYMVEPYLQQRPPRAPVATTDTVSVLGTD